MPTIKMQKICFKSSKNPAESETTRANKEGSECAPSPEAAFPQSLYLAALQFDPTKDELLCHSAFAIAWNVRNASPSI